MNSLRALLDGGIPLVAVSFDDSDTEPRAHAAKAAGVDVAELRVDRYARTETAHVLAQVDAFKALPVLATLRSAREGGAWKGTESQRLELFRALAPQVDAVDIELSSGEILTEVIEAAHRHDTVAVVSYHNFELTPGTEELQAVIDGAKSAGADVVKVSTMVRSDEDVRRLASLLLSAGADGTRLIVIAMGERGAVSRVFFPALGSRITYSFFGASSAPGQLAFPETFDLLRTFYPAFDQRKSAEG
ncbi:type I 3-dehydroquinate dehydratase [Streptomyces sp. NPDC006544]|uniref:type I 3-dehydroquinate dehydratase n=1 Tax=Streptomyces sp. NPDC006544 TaxID=3154583 RepID=UPI0033BC280D